MKSKDVEEDISISPSGGVMTGGEVKKIPLMGATEMPRSCDLVYEHHRGERGKGRMRSMHEEKKGSKEAI